MLQAQLPVFDRHHFQPPETPTFDRLSDHHMHVKLSLVIACLMGFAIVVHGDDALVIQKQAGEQNPTLVISEFAGDQSVMSLLQRALKMSDWFQLTSKPDARYQLRGQCEKQNGQWEVRFELFGDGKTVCAFRQQADASVPAKRMVFAGVDELIKRVFGNPGFCSTRLAYVKEIDGVKEIWTADFDGGSPTHLTRNGLLSVEPSWGPGATMAYTRYTKFATDLVLVDVQQRRHRVLSRQPGLNAGPAFANDGTRVAMTLSRGGTVDIYVVNLADGKLSRLTKDRYAEASPCWSPDDKSICYVSDGGSGRPRLYLRRLSGGRAKRLLKANDEMVSPDWSTVSNQICFAVRRGKRYTIATVDMRATPRKMTVHIEAEGDWESPSWAADGRHIVCSRSFQGAKALYLLDSLYGTIRPLQNFTGNDTLPDYSGAP